MGEQLNVAVDPAGGKWDPKASRLPTGTRWTVYGYRTMTQWEYETLRVPRGPTKKEISDPKAELNELGAAGWELVTGVDYTGGGTKYLLFKRPVSDEST